MPSLTNLSYIKELSQKYGFTFEKKFGQNFIINPSVCPRIVDHADIDENTGVIEIGTGVGVLTAELAKRAKKVVAIEIDTDLKELLKETLGEYDNIEIIFDDVLNVDLNALIEEKFKGMPVVVCANLPYYITSPIIMKLLEDRLNVENITVMVQKEVADRMQVGPGSKDYGALSLAVQYYAEPYIVANVPPNCFIPRPNVGSAVIRLTRHAKPPVEAKDKDLMFRLIRASFNQRRKTLQNGLSNAQDLSFSKEEIAAAIESLGLSPSVRGETLTLAQFAALSDVLGK